jgi:hypothetical protein
MQENTKKNEHSPFCVRKHYNLASSMLLTAELRMLSQTSKRKGHFFCFNRTKVKLQSLFGTSEKLFSG